MHDILRARFLNRSKNCLQPSKTNEKLIFEQGQAYILVESA